MRIIIFPLNQSNFICATYTIEHRPTIPTTASFSPYVIDDIKTTSLSKPLHVKVDLANFTDSDDVILSFLSTLGALDVSGMKMCGTLP